MAESATTGREPGTGRSDAPPGSPESAKLVSELSALLAEAQPLGESFLKLLRAQGELVWFLARENTRLLAVRALLWFLALTMFLSVWVFLSILLWRLAVDMSGVPATGPLVLLVTHLLAGVALLAWKDRMKL